MATLNDVLLGKETLNLYFAQRIAVHLTSEKSQKLEISLAKMNNLIGHANVITTLAALVIGVVVPFGFGIFQIIQGYLTIAAFMGIVQLSNRITNPLMAIISEFNAIQTTDTIMHSIHEIEPQTVGNQHIQIPHFKPFNKITFKDVSISRGEKDIITHLNIQIKKGDKVLIKAPSGYGKSTILHAMLGEPLISSGEYLLDDDKITQDEAQRLTSMVNQKPYLFNKSILFNITLGQHFTEQQIDHAIVNSQLTNLVDKYGLDYVVGEQGRNLSGGQAQRIEIARALIRNRPILLADEVTSALDEKLSGEIHNLLLSLPQTIVEVAHHISPKFEEQYDQVINL